MLELLVLISGVVILYRFSKSTQAVGEGAETKAQVWAEEVIMEAALKRADNYAAWKEAVKGKQIVTHDHFMNELRGTVPTKSEA